MPARVRTVPRVASIATTTACEPSRPASSLSKLGSLERSAVHGDLVGAGLEQGRGVRDRAHAAADGERDRETIGDPRDELDERVAPVQRRRDVEEDELVRARVGVQRAELDRVADVARGPRSARP